MPIDQAHEQNNEMIKGSGGAVGLTDYPTALRKSMIAGPEQARIINEFEGIEMKKETGHLHKETSNHQVKSQEKTSSHIAKLEEKGNPFLETGKIVLHDRHP
ncbi:hypothetical protein DPMN_101073 [Dreissena polymorpha]|uniref:Uncharacterized protein n=1 Tax=Dreissena polymorpha TaxID=45954 RepID=A0A9D4R9R0_DREPO|nr:hypothetical protein DPMN_101073 [Dreissena polymorpha]